MKLSSFPALVLATSIVAGAGCATQTLTLQTPRYNLAYPDYWEIVKKSDGDGKPTVVDRKSVV